MPRLFAPTHPPRLFAVVALSLAALAAFAAPAFPKQAETPGAKELREALVAWHKAGNPDRESPLSDALFHAARNEGRMDIAEELLAGGPVLKKMLPIPKGSHRVPLQVVRQFRPFHARLVEEMFESMEERENGWLARRITADRIEVWTATHGWLFDGAGKLLHEARPPRRKGTGREWYGAFLPDGRWVTTDLDEMDGNLYFFSPQGKLQRTLTYDELSGGDGDASHLIGWARSNGAGTGWVVNVGSEEGVATVQVGPSEPVRVLKGYERWKLCFPRALGPRGWYISLSVPEDSGRGEISRSEAGHGPGVGYPTYTFSQRESAGKASVPAHGTDSVSHIIPNGNWVFGYWPGSLKAFVGSDGNNVDELHFFNRDDAKLRDYEPSGIRTRKFQENILEGPPNPIIDKSWLFDADGNLVAWIRARRIADAADGRAMLFRVTADSRIVTLSSNMKVQAVRRMTWKDGATADAVTLWDDLGMGLFVRDKHLVLARWGAPPKR